MKKGETKTGFEFCVDERVLNDWKVVKLVAKIQKNESPMDSIECIESLGKITLTEKGFERMLKHIEKLNDGFCPIEKVGDEIADIFEQVNSKN